MSHEWDRGVLNESSWHGLEEIGVFETADDLIKAGRKSGAYPTRIKASKIQALIDWTSGHEDSEYPDDVSLASPDEMSVVDSNDEIAVVAGYEAHPSRIVGINGAGYTPNSPKAWDELIRAACLAGAKPTGCFSLREGRSILATFQVNGNQEGIVTNFLLTDSFDGFTKLTAGTTSVRVVCANTMNLAFRQDGAGMAGLKHTASLEEKVKRLADTIKESLHTGETLRELYRQACEKTLDKTWYNKIFDMLFPKAEDDAHKRGITRADNKREEALVATTNELNRVGDGDNLATLWNAATWLIDRDNDGKMRNTKGGTVLESMLFGTRGKRVAEIKALMESAIDPNFNVDK